MLNSFAICRNPNLDINAPRGLINRYSEVFEHVNAGCVWPWVIHVRRQPPPPPSVFKFCRSTQQFSLVADPPAMHFYSTRHAIPFHLLFYSQPGARLGGTDGVICFESMQSWVGHVDDHDWGISGIVWWHCCVCCCASRCQAQKVLFVPHGTSRKCI